MAFLTMPLNVYDDLLQYLDVRMISPLRALQKMAAQLFETTFTPHFYAALTRPLRLGGRLIAGPHTASFAETSMKSTMLTITVDVPIDWAAQEATPLPQRLLSQLPGPRKLWKEGALIIGVGFKKPRGTHAEFKGALQACAPQELRYLSMTDSRLPQHLPRPIIEESSLEVLHYAGAPTPEFLGKLQLFTHLPKAISFHRSCMYFLAWAAKNPELAGNVQCLGDVSLTPEGLQDWCRHVPVSSYVRKLGLSITTGRYTERSARWRAEDVFGVIMRTLPQLHTIGLNLEISYQCTEQHQETIMDLLAIVDKAGVRIVSFDVLLIQLPSSSRKRAERLESLSRELRERGVHMTQDPRPRNTKEIPSDGFEIPASLSLSAPSVVSRSVASALWQTVW